MKKDYSNRYLLVIIILFIILIVFLGYKILSDRGNSNEKDIDLSNLPEPPKKQALISGNVVFPTAPDSPSLEGIEGATISCGDTQCTGTESCSSCSIDCGTCPVQTPLRSSSGGGGGGGSRGSSNKIVTQDTQSSAQDQDTTSENNFDQNESTIETSSSVSSKKETVVTQATIPIGLYITIGIIILFAFIASIILWFFKKRGKPKKKEKPIKTTPPKKLVHNELIKAKRTYQ